MKCLGGRRPSMDVVVTRAGNAALFTAGLLVLLGTTHLARPFPVTTLIGGVGLLVISARRPPMVGPLAAALVAAVIGVVLGWDVAIRAGWGWLALVWSSWAARVLLAAALEHPTTRRMITLLQGRT